MVKRRPYIPDRGDIVWLTLHPQAGHEQSGRRPAVVISPKKYNRKVGLALFCPITTQIKGYPFEVLLPEGLPISGAILSDQVKSLDWNARRAEYSCTAPESVTMEVLGKLETLISW